MNNKICIETKPVDDKAFLVQKQKASLNLKCSVKVYSHQPKAKTKVKIFFFFDLFAFRLGFRSVWMGP